MRLEENTVIAGRFRLNKLLGRGGMGSVWLATHLGLDIPCAVKFIEGEMSKMAEARVRFEREAKAAAQLRSPHVVQILDHGICEDTPYIAMELLEGEDLGKRLTKMTMLPPAEVHRILNQVCRALSKAHALGIVHRDLKPDNIFLVNDEHGEIAKVLDFGIAKKNSVADLGGSNTKTGAVLGTPYYMSPEQAQGTKAVDFRSDLWALAVIAFQAITGRLPFESEALGDLLVRIIVAPMPVPSQFGRVPPGFDRWWAKAAAREPSERYQSAKEFADQLGYACGVSAISGVIDRSHLRVAADESGGSYATGGPPQMGQPAPLQMMAQTPPPMMPMGPMSPMMGTAPPAMTPAPMSRTFGQEVGGVAPSKAGLVAGIAAGATLLVALLGIAIFFAVRKAPASPSAGETSGASSVVAQATAADPPPVAPPVVTPPPVASAAAVTDAKPVDPAASVAVAPPSKHHGSTPSGGHASPAASTPKAHPTVAEPAGDHAGF